VIAIISLTKTHYIKFNTFSLCNQYIYTKSGSYVEVSFSIFNRFPLLTLSFNSLGLSGGVPLMSLTTISPRLFFFNANANYLS